MDTPLQPLAIRHMTFDEFSKMNRARCDGAFHRGEAPWGIDRWALAIAGEAGELCNLVKKCIRGDFTFESQRQNILNELADVMTYCDLAISYLDANTAQVIWDKFEKVNERIGWKS
jgi:NTP pyrophosphatase (non-canonical NTP hydrolase)